jgi:DNA modification methylase
MQIGIELPQNYREMLWCGDTFGEKRMPTLPLNPVDPFALNRVHAGDCLDLMRRLPADSIDIVVTSPPYWGQRSSGGVGVEEDPREYLQQLMERFREVRRVLKPEGIFWINIGDAYNTPVNWTETEWVYSSLGPGGRGLDPTNTAYTKPRHKRKAFIQKDEPWLQYGNLLALPYRLVISLCDAGFLFRGEIVWSKVNPMPEGRCRRPHRAHETIYLFAKSERHQFRIHPPVRTIWEFANDSKVDVRHYSRFPFELPRRCIEAFGKSGEDVIVMDPFSGSGTTGIAARWLGCSYLGFEIDEALVGESNNWLAKARPGQLPQAKPLATQKGALLFDV